MLSETRVDPDALRAAYAAAHREPYEAVQRLGISSTSSRDAVRAAFAGAYKHTCGPSGLECTTGRTRLEDGIDLFMREGQLPDFVAHYCAGLALTHELAEA